MTGRANYIKAFALVLWSVALSSFFILLSAIPLLPLARSLGRAPFVLLGLGLSLMYWGLGQPAVALYMVSICATLGVLIELEPVRRISTYTSLFIAALSGWLLAAGSFVFWARTHGTTWQQALHQRLDFMLSEAQKLMPGFQSSIPTAQMIDWAPALLAILLILTLFFALLCEPHILKWLGERPAKRERLSALQAPDFMIWVFIVGLLGTALKGDLGSAKTVAMNLLAVSSFLYTLQGLAVLAQYMEFHRVALVWRVIFFILLIGAGLIVPGVLPGVALVGLVDYWADFRSRFVKKNTQVKKQMGESK